jgi:hypothetical protein
MNGGLNISIKETCGDMPGNLISSAAMPVAICSLLALYRISISENRCSQRLVGPRLAESTIFRFFTEVTVTRVADALVLHGDLGE